MSGRLKLEIAESLEELKTLMLQQKTAAGRERLQLLYLLKSEPTRTVVEWVPLVGRDRTTLQRWLAKYRQGGLSRLLAPRTGQGRKQGIPPEAQAKLRQYLEQAQGFSSYGEIQQWLKQECGVSVGYHVVHAHVRYRLQAKPKVARPCSVQQSPQAAQQFQKNSNRG